MAALMGYSERAIDKLCWSVGNTWLDNYEHDGTIAPIYIEMHEPDGETPENSYTGYKDDEWWLRLSGNGNIIAALCAWADKIRSGTEPVDRRPIAFVLVCQANFATADTSPAGLAEWDQIKAAHRERRLHEHPGTMKAVVATWYEPNETVKTYVIRQSDRKFIMQANSRPLGEVVAALSAIDAAYWQRTVKA